MFLHTVGETQSKLRVGGKRLKDAGDVGAAGEGTAGEVVGGDHAPLPAQHLFAVGAERAFGVPQVKPPLGPGTAFAAGTPVVVRPVVHVDVDAEHDVVDEVIEINQRGRLFVVRRKGEVGADGEALESTPLEVVSLADFSELRDEIPLGTAAVTRAEEVDVHPLGRVVVGLALTVEQQIHEDAPAGGVTEIAVQPAAKFVAYERVDRVIHAGAQHHMLKLIQRQVGKKPMVQPALAVAAAEIKPKRILAPRHRAVRRVATPDEVPALQPQTTLDLESVRTVREKQFGGSLPLPCDPSLVGVARLNLEDTGFAPEIFPLSDQRHDRQGGNGLGVAQYVGVRCRSRRPRATTKRRRTNDRGLGDRDRRPVQRAVLLRRQRVIGRVTDHRTIFAAAQLQLERLRE